MRLLLALGSLAERLVKVPRNDFQIKLFVLSEEKKKNRGGVTEAAHQWAGTVIYLKGFVNLTTKLSNSPDMGVWALSVGKAFLIKLVYYYVGVRHNWAHTPTLPLAVQP